MLAVVCAPSTVRNGVAVFDRAPDIGMRLQEVVELGMLRAKAWIVDQLGISSKLAGRAGMLREEFVEALVVVTGALRFQVVPDAGMILDVIQQLRMIGAPLRIVDLIWIGIEN